MTNKTDFPKPSKFLKDISPYATVSSREVIEQNSSVLPPLKLDWNEATIPPSPHVIETLQRALSDKQNLLNWYCDLTSKKLSEKIAVYTHQKTENILVTNGSDDGLDLICKTYLDPEDNVMVLTPTYTHFSVYVKSRGAHLIEVSGQDPFSNSLSLLIDNAHHQPKLIYMVNPNNPTGVYFPESEIISILEAFPDSVVIVDEAYWEFSGKTAINLTSSFPNLFVTRSFSKAWALAGMRIGYIATAAENIDTLKILFNPKSVNVLAQLAAQTALEDPSYCENYVKEVRESKKLLSEFFETHGFSCVEGESNFLMVKCTKCSLSTLFEAFEHENIFVRDRSSLAHLDGFFRINLGTLEQSRDLLERLDRIFSTKII